MDFYMILEARIEQLRPGRTRRQLEARKANCAEIQATLHDEIERRKSCAA